MSEGARRKPTGGLALLFLGMTIVVPMVLLVECGHTEGSIAVTASPHGDFTIEADECYGLLPHGTFGAALRGAGEDSGAAYVAADPTGQGRFVEIEVPGSCVDRDPSRCERLSVSEASCGTFDIEVENTGVTVNDVRLVKGHAALECQLPDGTEISGRIDFDGC